MGAQKEAAAALALAASRRKSEETQISIKLRRSSTGDTASIVTPDDAATRRSSRPIKRRKFDDELQAQPSPGIQGVCIPAGPTQVEAARSRNTSLCSEPSWDLW